MIGTILTVLGSAYIASQVVIVLFFTLVYIARTRQEKERCAQEHDDGPTL